MQPRQKDCLMSLAARGNYRANGPERLARLVIDPLSSNPQISRRMTFENKDYPF